MELAAIHILSVGVLQEFTDVLDVDGLTILCQHLRVEGGIATETFLQLPRTVHLVEILGIILVFLGFLDIRPIDHHHIVLTQAVEEHRQRRGVLRFLSDSHTVGEGGVGFRVRALCLVAITACHQEDATDGEGN